MSVATFDQIFGQRSAKRIIASALRSGRLHHAWIFHGPPGIGKRTTAEAFAAAVMAPGTRVGDDDSISIDRDADTIRYIEAGTHPDLHMVVKELALYSEDASVRARKLTTIPTDVIRQHLVEPAGRTSQRRDGGLAGKVFIVDEAELMNLQAQNAMLKTLEEPPPGSVIILVTSAPQRLLPTIRSRCQRVAFEPLDDASMEGWLAAHLASADRKPSEAEQEWAIHEFAAGSPGRALLAFEGGFFDLSRELAPLLDGAERGEYPASLGRTLTKFIDEWAKAQVDAAPNASKDAANKAGARQVFTLLSERARRRLTEQDSRPHALRTIELIDGAERELAGNVQLAMVMEHLAAGLCRN